MSSTSAPLDQLVVLVQHASRRHRDNVTAAESCCCGSRCVTCELRLATSSRHLLSALERLESAQEELERIVHGR